MTKRNGWKREKSKSQNTCCVSYRVWTGQGRAQKVGIGPRQTSRRANCPRRGVSRGSDTSFEMTSDRVRQFHSLRNHTEETSWRNVGENALDLQKTVNSFQEAQANPCARGVWIATARMVTRLLKASREERNYVLQAVLKLVIPLPQLLFFYLSRMCIGKARMLSLLKCRQETIHLTIC